MRLRASVALFLVVGVLAPGLGGCRGQAPILVSMPHRAEQGATSTDVELCSRVTPRFIMDLPEIGGEPTLDVAMEDTDTPCVWQLPKGTALKRGTYSILVRFDAELGDRGTCPNGRVAIGAFAKEAIAFPFPEGFRGFREDDFLSSPTDAVPGAAGLSFDGDEDGRDAYAEVASGTDPCAPNEPPTITFEPETPLDALVDEQAVFWDIRSEDQDDTPHEVTLQVRHRNSGAGTPVATLTLPTNGDPPTIDPPPEAHGREGWLLDVESQDTDDRPGAGHWRVRFLVDEPFIGPLDIEVQPTIGGVPIGEATRRLAQVADVPDPTSLVAADNAALAFAEIRVDSALSEEAQRLDALERATAVRLEIRDEDLDADVSAFSIAVGDCPGLHDLRPDAPAFLFRWAPDNDVAVTQPAEGHRCAFEITDGAGAVVDSTELLLRVSPLVNDPPHVSPPDLAALQLPPPGFVEFAAPFVVIDPDQVPTAPTCDVTMVPAGSTTCTAAQAFEEVRCEAVAQQGTAWSFVLTLVAAAGYATCGERPGFDAHVSITDTSPDENSASLVVSNDACTGASEEPDDCVPLFSFRTVDRMVAATIAGGAGIAAFTADVLPLIEPSSGVGLMTVVDDSFNKHMVLAQLSGTPRIAAEVPATTARSFESSAIALAAADPVNARFLAQVRDGSGNLRALLVDLGSQLTASTYTLIDPGAANVCDEPFNGSMGKPVVDPVDGTFYLPCIGRGTSPPARLIRIAPDGTRTQKEVTGARPPCDGCSNGDQFALVVSPVDDTKWVVFPEETGFVLVDLSTFDSPTPATTHVIVGGNFDADRIFASAVDVERGAYLYAWDTGTTSTLGRIDFSVSPPVLDAAQLDLGDIGTGRLVLKGSGTSAPAEPDLIVWPSSSSDDRAVIDLDSWSITDTRSFLEFPNMVYGSGLLMSPDARFAVGLNGCLQDTDPLYNVSGGWFVPWDDSPPFFVDIGLGCAPSSTDPTFAGRYVVSEFGDDLVVLTFAGGD